LEEISWSFDFDNKNNDSITDTQMKLWQTKRESQYALIDEKLSSIITRFSVTS